MDITLVQRQHANMGKGVRDAGSIVNLLKVRQAFQVPYARRC
jgi:hypothetical protein